MLSANLVVGCCSSGYPSGRMILEWLKANGCKSIPERWLVFSVCPKAHACSTNPSTIVESIMQDGFLEHAGAFGHTLKTNHLSGVDLPPFAFSVCPAAHTHKNKKNMHEKQNT